MPPEASPVDFDAIVSAFTRGDRADARAMAAAALENGLDEPLVLYLVAEEAEEQGRELRGDRFASPSNRHRAGGT